MIAFASCKTASISQNIQGVYYKEGKDYEYSLSLNNDSSFAITKKYLKLILYVRGNGSGYQKIHFY